MSMDFIGANMIEHTNMFDNEGLLQRDRQLIPVDAYQEKKQ